jgi:hypothetical protein
MSTRRLYAGPTAADLDQIPADLKARPQWVLWRGADRIDKDTGEITGLDKIPIDPHTLHRASTADAETWETFEYCVDALPVALEQWENEDPSTYRGGGIGYVLTSDDSYTGVDLDHCRNTDTGAIANWAQTWIDTLKSYTQVSVSGTGIHIFVEATLPPGRRQSGHYQMWDHSRFFAMTGQHLPGTLPTIEPREIPLAALWCTLFAPKIGEIVWTKDTHGNITNKDPLTITAIEPAPSGELYARFAESQTGWPLVRCELASGTSTQGATPALEDDAILDKARKAKNGDKFTRLWDGDIVTYSSPSEADLALCCILAFWTREAAQIDRLFRQSNLMREKWEKRADYRKRTITAALTLQAEHYTQHDSTQLIVKRATQQAQQGQNGLTVVTLPNSTGSSDGSGTPGQPPPDQRPDIIIGPDITRIVDEVQTALLGLPDAPVLYQRARRLCVIARGVKPPKWLHRPQDIPVSIEASSAHLWELAGQAAKWWKLDKRAKKYELALPPKWFVEALQGRDGWPFPVLEGIVCSPTLRPDGSLLGTPGYDPDTGLLLDTNSTTFPRIPFCPTLDNARTAIGHLQQAFIDFPFAESWHFSAALAAVLSLVCRYAIMGNVPLFAIRANTRGSGKSLLADVVSIIGTGRAAPRWPQVTEDEEERKRLLTVALAGYPAIHIDNVTKPLGSPALDLALTAPSFSDRILGKHDSREAPLSMVWLASGNNMQFKGDTARRIVPIDLDPQMERPEERTGFQHNPLTPWVQQERPRLTVAALTIIKAFFEAGCPAQGVTPMGSFEQWSDLIRQALIWAGEADPNEGRKDIEAESDPQYERLATLLDAWTQCYPKNDAWTLAQVKGDIQTRAALSPQPPNAWNVLQEALGAFDPRYDSKNLNTQVLGYEFRKFQGRTIAGRRFVTAGISHHAQQWAIEQV